MMMPLTVLEPSFRRYLEQGYSIYTPQVENIDDAHGLQFLCPKCFRANGGPVGTHAILCWSRLRGAPDHANPGPGRWAMSGENFADMTLRGESGRSDSIRITGGCGWHGYIEAGQVRDA